jgi:hypothetical protein
MLKEFVEQLKLYKELLAIVAAGVVGSLFVVSYFATKEALDDAHQRLDALITQRECELSSRITIAESSVVISRLEKEKLENTIHKKELLTTAIPKAPAGVQAILREQVSALEAKRIEIADEIATHKKVSAEARRALDTRECAGKAVH